MLQALNRAANVGLGLAPMCHRPAIQPKPCDRVDFFYAMCLEGVKSKPEHATLSTACCPSLPLRFGPTLLAAKQATRLKATPRRTQRRNDRANTWQLLAAEPVACRTAAAAGAWSKERRRNGCLLRDQPYGPVICCRDALTIEGASVQRGPETPCFRISRK
jgi:hypothetical protein